MTRYYILTETHGIGVIEAELVDESDASTTLFVGAGRVTTYGRNELLWWSPVEAKTPAPFANLTRKGPQPWPWHFHVTPATGRGTPMPFGPIQRSPNYTLCSRAAVRAIEKLVVSRLPPEWTKAALEIRVAYELPADRYRLTHRLRNPDTHAEVMDFSDELFAAIEVHHRIAVESGENWVRSTITMTLDRKAGCVETRIDNERGIDFSGR